MEEKRGLEGESSLKRSEARKGGSSVARKSQDGLDGSSKPKRRQMSTGKAMEKKLNFFGRLISLFVCVEGEEERKFSFLT
ncbi:hypothetical protein J5N97_024009 [Dioscorea zingiberensis]|uniref:Uncharacterized protein n=1 Tax=Dioscorea zingiberensis TaxID=325984 RepID=A0A9D5C6W1_9LILI|nr:hypothetical protein J5N97_024009 [Dioscorea zingiberensis]